MEITYEVGKYKGQIIWAASEYFGELVGRNFGLGEMEATQIERLSGLSPTAKLLLLAVAGAIIQRLLDSGVEPETIFNDGKFRIGA